MANLSHHRPRPDGTGDSLVTRQAAAHLMKRHVDQVSRHCEPVACDVPTRLALYSMDAVFHKIATLRRRAA